MTPTIIESEGRLWAVLGTPGGSTIITTVAQMILLLRDFGMELEKAVAWPRFHHQWIPDRIDHEEHCFSPDTRRLLDAKGYQLNVREDIGDVHAIRVHEDGTLVGAADPRGIGAARGF